MKQLRKIQKLVAGVASTTLVVLSFLLSSCINDHCNEQMYTPLSVNFYSEIDTAKEVVPLFMVWNGEGSDSIMTVSGSSIALPLNPGQDEVRFAVAVAHTACETEVLIHYDSTTTYTTLDHSQTYELTSSQGNYYNFDHSSEIRMYAGAEDSFCVFYKPVIDTLKVTYTPNIEFVSAECGCMNTYEIKSVRFEHGKIGNPAIRVSTVNNMTDAKHIKIFLENY